MEPEGEGDHHETQQELWHNECYGIGSADLTQLAHVLSNRVVSRSEQTEDKYHHDELDGSNYAADS
jgi:hypothetical protein